MGRKRITEGTLKKLFALSGNNCAFAGCQHSVLSEHGDLIAEVCHIEAAEPGGQRYNTTQTDDQRRAYQNLIILCRTHHATTDNVDEYDVSRLQQMKRDHEDQFRHQPFEFSEDTWRILLGELTGRLREQVENLKVPLDEVRTELATVDGKVDKTDRKLGRWLIAVAVLGLLSVGIGGFVVWQQKTTQEEANQRAAEEAFQREADRTLQQ